MCLCLQVAIKKVLQDKRFKNRELQIIRMMNHPNIVQLKHCFYTTTEKDEVRMRCQCRPGETGAERSCWFCTAGGSCRQGWASSSMHGACQHGNLSREVDCV